MTEKMRKEGYIKKKIMPEISVWHKLHLSNIAKLIEASNRLSKIKSESTRGKKWTR